MTIDFTVQNYRSLKGKTTLSLEASTSKGKPSNLFELQTKGGKKFRLLKTAVIYGPNASGKSNLIRAFWSFRQLIYNSFKYDVTDNINLAESFALSSETEFQPSKFSLNFIGWDMYQYIYSITVSRTEGIIEESLKYYPNKNQILIYKRKGRKILRKNPNFFKNNLEIKNINPKRLYLSELGNSGDEYWENIRNYFVIGNSVANVSINGMQRILTENAKNFFENTDSVSTTVKNKVVRLLQLSDLGLKNIKLIEEDEIIKPEGGLPNETNESYSESRKIKKFKTYHETYNNNSIVGLKEFDLMQQGSAGTLALLGLSSEIVLSLTFPEGRTIWIDEIDNSLHPYLSRFLINLFNHPNSNPHNAQLIFATHETTLLDKNNFRKDQIWITKKDKYGCTILYSVYDLDIDGFREDVPFDKWYISGKFGGLPNIKELDFIFNRIDNDTNGEKKK